MIIQDVDTTAYDIQVLSTYECNDLVDTGCTVMFRNILQTCDSKGYPQPSQLPRRV